jgi:hypothetical protein
MTTLSEQLGKRMRQQVAEILKQAPYDDEPVRALNRTRCRVAEHLRDAKLKITAGAGSL